MFIHMGGDRYSAFCEHCKSHVNVDVGTDQCPHCAEHVEPLDPAEAEVLIPSKP